MVIPLSILIFYFFLSPHYALIHAQHHTSVFVYLPLHSLTLIPLHSLKFFQVNYQQSSINVHI